MSCVPPTNSEKTKESKLLVRSFRHIYKVTGFAVATGISGLFSFTSLRSDRKTVVNDSATRQISEGQSTSDEFELSELISSDEFADNTAASTPTVSSETESQIEFAKIAKSTEVIDPEPDVVEPVLNNEGGICKF
ncbi:MAG: hypothetical protein ACR2LL_12145 [Nitrosopumilus sp.]